MPILFDLFCLCLFHGRTLNSEQANLSRFHPFPPKPRATSLQQSRTTLNRAGKTVMVMSPAFSRETRGFQHKLRLFHFIVCAPHFGFYLGRHLRLFFSHFHLKFFLCNSLFDFEKVLRLGVQYCMTRIFEEKLK